MKIAIISTKKISLTSGSDRRNYQLAIGLGKKYQVKTYTPISSYKVKQLSLGKRIFFLFRNAIPYVEQLKQQHFHDKEIKEIQKADFIQLEEMTAYYAFEKYLPQMTGKIVLDTHNIDYIRFLSEVKKKNVIEKYIGKLLATKLKLMEREAIMRVDHIFVCSEKEKNYYRNYINQNKITVVPNGANVTKNNHKQKIKKNTILFMGLLSYAPNQEGLRYYIEQVHPRVLKNIQNATLVILGKDAPQWLKDRAEQDSSIQLKGFVKDVQPYIDRAHVCICPILSGSGTRLKILEYMAHAKPVISTMIGAEGISVTDNNNILLADNPKKFANNIIRCISQKQLTKRIGNNARTLIKDKYSWESITQKLGRVYENFNG